MNPTYKIAIPRDTVYILHCIGDRYYVGYTKYLHFRLVQHFGNKGAKFTRKYKPLSVLAWFDGDTKREHEVWRKFAKQFGAINVGGYTS